MATAKMQHYLNPLTIEAQNFLNSLNFYAKACNEIDHTLCTALENVVKGIEKFLDQNPAPVVATESTKLVPSSDLASIQRLFHCSVCKKDLGKTPDKAVIHLVDRHRSKTRNDLRKEKKQAEQKRRESIVSKLPKKAKAIISGDLAKFFADHLQIAEKLKWMPDYDLIETHLMEFLVPLLPDKSIKLYKFGSRISGIGTRNSDLDIFIDIDNTFNSFENRASQKTLHYLHIVHDALKNRKSQWRQLYVIESARVPIITVTHIPTGIECDIGFSNSLGYCNTKLINYMFQLQPIAQHMCIFLKKWLERTRLSEHLSTYSITLMVIYFLQIRNSLPSIELLQCNMLANVLVGPWIANFMEKPLTEFNIELLDTSPSQCRQILQDFCRYFANFKYDLYVVCPYYGKEQIAIKGFEHTLPERYKNFVAKNESYGKDSKLELMKCMVVQDPVQMNHNVTKSVSKFHLKEFVAYMKQSADLFEDS